MDYVIFSAIEVGSSELSMKIYEMSKNIGITQLDYLRQPIELGAETYDSKKISHNNIKAICKILNGFKRSMKEYGVTSYVACATSAIREASNSITVLDRIKVTTGIEVKVLSNSEKRFLYYKAIAMRNEEFNKIIRKGTAIVDVGAGSIQISLYDKDSLISTQNIKLGFLRIKKILSELGYKTKKYNKLISEYIENDLNTYKRLFLGEVELKNIIAVGDNITELSKLCLRGLNSDYVIKELYYEFFENLSNLRDETFVEQLGITDEQASLVVPTAMIYKKIFEITKAEKMWFPQIQFNDGLAVDYAETNNIIKLSHDFAADIVQAARRLGQRYNCNIKHAENVENIALQMYDRLKKVHGLGQRERLYTQLATILHNCGTYINMNEVPLNSYNIVMSTEIIGLSHMERTVVANLVKYMSYELPDYDEFATLFDEETYISVTKITAILRLANALDKSHMQKFREINIQLVDNNMIMTVDSIEDITLEKKVFNKMAEFFIDVYGVKPKLKQKHKQ